MARKVVLVLTAKFMTTHRVFLLLSIFVIELVGLRLHLSCKPCELAHLSRSAAATHTIMLSPK